MQSKDIRFRDIVVDAEFENCRGHDVGDVDELKASIKAVGLLQPLLVRERPNGKYALRGGFRRYAAIYDLIDEDGEDIAEVPVRVLGEDESQDYIINVVENIERNTLKPLQIAAAVAKLNDDGWTVGALADKFARSTTWVSSQIVIHNKLHPLVKMAIENGWITLTQALQLRNMSKEEQEELLVTMIDDPHQLANFKDELDNRRDPRPGLKKLRLAAQEILTYEEEMQEEYGEAAPDADYRKGVLYALRWVEGVESSGHLKHPNPNP